MKMSDLKTKSSTPRFSKNVFSSVEAKTPEILAAELRERIEMKAYELYEKRGRVKGCDWQDWFEAKRIVESEMTSASRN